jgi:hypothetical protein
MNRPPLPPLHPETIGQKARIAEDVWNAGDPRGLQSPTRLSQSGGVCPGRAESRLFVDGTQMMIAREHEAFLQSSITVSPSVPMPSKPSKRKMSSPVWQNLFLTSCAILGWASPVLARVTGNAMVFALEISRQGRLQHRVARPSTRSLRKQPMQRYKAI